MRLLKDRVDESGAADGKPVSDETIAGVAGLVGIEVSLISNLIWRRPPLTVDS